MPTRIIWDAVDAGLQPRLRTSCASAARARELPLRTKMIVRHERAHNVAAITQYQHDELCAKSVMGGQCGGSGQGQRRTEQDQRSTGSPGNWRRRARRHNRSSALWRTASSSEQTSTAGHRSLSRRVCSQAHHFAPTAHMLLHGGSASLVRTRTRTHCRAAPPAMRRPQTCSQWAAPSYEWEAMRNPTAIQARGEAKVWERSLGDAGIRSRRHTIDHRWVDTNTTLSSPKTWPWTPLQ